MISEDEDSTLYNPVTRKSRTPVNQKRGGNVLSISRANTDAPTCDTVREPHTGGGSNQNV